MNHPLFNTCYSCGQSNKMMHSERLCCECWWDKEDKK